MTQPTQQVFRIDRESLSFTDHCLAVEGVSDGVTYSIHLRFTASEDSCIELFQFEPGLIAVNGIIEPGQKDALLKEVYDEHTITLPVSDTDRVPLRSGYPPELAEEGLGVGKSA